MKKIVIRNALEFFVLNIGLLILAFSFVCFLIPLKLAAGGVYGIATIIHHLFNFPVGMLMLVINIPLLFIGVFVFGKAFGYKTIYSTIALSFIIDFYTYILKFTSLTTDLLIGALYGGILAGIGIGLAMKVGGSTGGTDILAQMLRKYFKVPTGYALILVDTVVLIGAGVVFGVEIALHAIISLFVLGKTINFILEGDNSSRIAYIISEKREEIRNIVIAEIGGGGTLLEARGLFTGDDRNVVMTVIKRRDLAMLKRSIALVDPKAFVIISEAHEVLGEGFTFEQGAL